AEARDAKPVIALQLRDRREQLRHAPARDDHIVVDLQEPCRPERERQLTPDRPELLALGIRARAHHAKRSRIPAALLDSCDLLLYRRGMSVDLDDERGFGAGGHDALTEIPMHGVE